MSKVTLCLVFTLIRSLNGSNRHFLNHRGKTKINRSFQNFLFVIGLLLLWFWRYDTHFKTALYCLVGHSTGKSEQIATRGKNELHGFCVNPENASPPDIKNRFSEYRDERGTQDDQAQCSHPLVSGQIGRIEVKL